jgi:hypothetical protein
MDENSSLVRNRVGNPQGRVDNATGPHESDIVVSRQPHGNLLREPV